MNLPKSKKHHTKHYNILFVIVLTNQRDELWSASYTTFYINPMTLKKKKLINNKKVVHRSCALTKKSSISGGAKKTICLRRNTQFFVTLGFLGAGGHVSNSGILDFWAFGVQQPPSPPGEASTAGEGEGGENDVVEEEHVDTIVDADVWSRVVLVLVLLLCCGSCFLK